MPTVRPQNTMYRIYLDPEEGREEWPEWLWNWNSRRGQKARRPERCESEFHALMKFAQFVYPLEERKAIEARVPGEDWSTAVVYQRQGWMNQVQPVLVWDPPDNFGIEVRLTVMFRQGGVEEEWHFRAEEVDDAD